jgi:hypothetical protein
MTYRDVPNGIGHREDLQAEGERHANQPDAQVNGGGAFGNDEFGRQDRAAAAAKNEPKSAEEFGE